MKAVYIEQPGGRRDALRRFPQARARPGQVLVKIAAAGVNFIDTYQRCGLYKFRCPPCWDGRLRHSGKVGRRRHWIQARRSRRLGHVARQVRRVSRGARESLGEGSRWRGCATAAAHAARHDRALPNAFHFPLEPGHTALVHAAAGGTGRLIAQMAAARRARDRHGRHREAS